MKECPQCGSRVTNAVQMTGEWISARCNDCGWDSKYRPKLYSSDEALAELLDAVREVLGRVHVSGTAFAVQGVHRSHADRLRDEADALDARDAALRRLRWAHHRASQAEPERADGGES